MALMLYLAVHSLEPARPGDKDLHLCMGWEGEEDGLVAYPTLQVRLIPSRLSSYTDISHLFISPPPIPQMNRGKDLGPSTASQPL